MNGKITVKDIVNSSFPIAKGLIPNSVYDKILDETTYNLYIVNLYKFDSSMYPHVYYQDDIVKCTETELPIFKKLGYTYYQDGCIGGGMDEEPEIYLYRIGYYTHTIPDCFGNTKRWMPVLNKEDRNKRIELHWELEKKYNGIIKKIQNNKKWNFIFTIMNVNLNTSISFCKEIIYVKKNIPPEIAHIIWEYWRE